jgi:hypothetical protein
VVGHRGHDPWGLVYFARPLIGTDANLGTPIETQMVMWGRALIPPADAADASGPDLSWERRGAFAAERHAGPDGRVPAISMRIYGRGSGRWHQQGGTDWHFGADTEALTDDGFDDLHRDSMAEDRRWLAALWLLAAQPLAEATGRHGRRSRRTSD